jgi:hypothetical protein
LPPIIYLNLGWLKSSSSPSSAVSGIISKSLTILYDAGPGRPLFAFESTGAWGLCKLTVTTFFGIGSLN